ncbi:hypothetical protein ElyMa_005454400 [Elysia marginata]|uniref:Uncharacterized protein n=1 Tax=Elysia marginata TaxID=1093978 RepID=A0AAV4EPM6_9GAST|nr:hypothetical protein ElyMa_005454400 [Elysia marginata]
MPHGPAQENEAHSGENQSLVDGLANGLRQPIVCCKTHISYGCYYVICYRRRRARSLLTPSTFLPSVIKTDGKEQDNSTSRYRKKKRSASSADNPGLVNLDKRWLLIQRS